MYFSGRSGFINAVIWINYNRRFDIIKRSGPIAQLARALPWHGRGQGFEPPWVHQNMEEILTSIGDSTVSVCAVFVTGDTFLVGLRHYGPHKILWTIPGGRCHGGETLETALRREVMEEIGIQDLTIANYLGQVPGYKEGDTVHVFLCETAQIPQLLEPDKFSEWRYMKVSDIAESFMNKDVLSLIKAVVVDQ